jgi:hypothetical protein
MSRSISRSLPGIFLIAVLVGTLTFLPWQDPELEIEKVFRWPGIAIFIGLVVVHEAVHGVGFLLSGAKLSHLKFGIGAWLSPYAHLDAQISMRGYRLTTVLPGLVVGLIPLAICWILGAAFWGALFYLMLICAAGDFYALWLTRKIPADASVRDHPSQLGVLVEDKNHS